MDGAGAYGAGKAGGNFQLIEFIQTPQVILRLVNILFSIIVFGSITSQGWHFDLTTKREECLYNGDPNACNYGVGIGVIAFLGAVLLLAGEYMFPQMSSVKTRRHFVIGDMGFSALWSFLYFVGFCYLASQWTKAANIPEAAGSSNNMRAAIAFSFFSVFSWGGSAFFGYKRYREGSDSAFATAYETNIGSGVGAATTPGSGGGYTSFPGMGTTADPIGAYQAPPFSSTARTSSLGDYQPPPY
nr:EOG090X0FHR [Cyclestheria hislopi]